MILANFRVQILHCVSSGSEGDFLPTQQVQQCIKAASDCADRVGDMEGHILFILKTAMKLQQRWQAYPAVVQILRVIDQMEKVLRLRYEWLLHQLDEGSSDVVGEVIRYAGHIAELGAQRIEILKTLIKRGEMRTLMPL